MKKIIGWYKNLSPEMKIILALAGLATPSGLVYFAQNMLGLPAHYVLLGFAAVVVVVGGLAWLLGGLFSLRSRKRSERMASDLAGGAQSGPVSMDLRASIQANNEKFFTAIRDMRKEVKIDVYDLPWYIVIGDSGCGKTKLVNESGLTFSRGKPEGYQLGTLNYNWWFTEDAVFIDMAGRLCNPQDDGDRREWGSFLDTIAKGRKGFPVNGAIVCISAEHLLQDGADKHEQDANTVLERLRDLQGKLGVTFSTYLVITKCDKILGFMQFFDRAVNDPTLKLQMYGWSKPGEFNQLYDPEHFTEDFNELYGRLNDLRLRRLSDDVDELELGMAYSFPEEFRELLVPLQTYVRTLFPMIKNPRAIKNLIFRGVYFTSATQQGSVILKHLTERLGTQVADQFDTLDQTYPTKRPFFIKDLLFKKVFKEFGLVFRNEDQVVRNRRASNWLKVGSVVLGGLLFGTLGMTGCKFNKLIVAPRENAVASLTKIQDGAEALKHIQTLDENVAGLNNSKLLMNVLALGVNADRPIDNLKTIQARLFENAVMRGALQDVGAALRDEKPLPQPGEKGAAAAFKAYADALEQYVGWYANSAAQDVSPGKLPAWFTYEQFKVLCQIAAPKSLIVTQKELFDKQAANYFEALKTASEDWKNPARFLRDPSFQAQDTIVKAIGKVRNYLAAYAALNAKHPNTLIAEWMRIRLQCELVQKSYDQITATKTDDVRSLGDFDRFLKQFSENYKTFDEALAGCAWKAPPRGDGVLRKIQELAKLLGGQRDRWLEYAARLRKAYLPKPPPDDPVVKAIEGLHGDAEDLDHDFYVNLKAAGLLKATAPPYDKNFFDPNEFPKYVVEVFELYGHIIRFVPPVESMEIGSVTLTDSAAKVVQPTLKQINDRLAQVSSTSDEGWGDRGVEQWNADLRDYLKRAGEEQSAAGQIPGADKLETQWKKDALQRLFAEHAKMILRGEGTRKLATIEDRLKRDKIKEEEWGFARLVPEWNRPVESVYNIPAPAAPARATEEAPKPKTTQPAKPVEEDDIPALGAGGGNRAPAAPVAPQAPVAVVKPGEGVPHCARPEFFLGVPQQQVGAAQQYLNLANRLRNFKENYYFGDEQGAKRHERCAQEVAAAWARYVDTYAKEWNAAYQKKTLAGPAALLSAGGWGTFAKQFTPGGARPDADYREIGRQVRNGLREVLQATGGVVAQLKGSDRAEYQGIGAALEKALAANWQDGQSVLRSGQWTRGPEGKDPWNGVADDAGKRWDALCKVIGDIAELPNEFDKDRAPLTGVSWDLGKWQNSVGLDDEKMLKRLVEFESRTKALLSDELTGRLRGIQAGMLGGQSPDGGWPYLGGLNTVDFNAFKNFLRAVENAEKIFAQVDQGLPNGERRQEFYKGGREWRAFLGLDSGGNVRPLHVKIWLTDGPNSEKSSQYYNFIGFDLGLKSGGATGALKFPTKGETSEKLREGDWDWLSNQSGEIVLQLLDGIDPAHIAGEDRYPPSKITLGRSSPLVIAAYLRQGQRDGDAWVTVHPIDLSYLQNTVFSQDAQKRIAPAFKIQLDRALPAPIQGL